MSLLTGNQLGLLLCDAFGVPRKHVSAVYIECLPGKPAVIKFERRIDGAEADVIAAIFSKCAMVEKAP